MRNHRTKKTIFIEGEENSIDIRVYKPIAEKILPQAQIVSVGGVGTIMNIDKVLGMIQKAIPSVDVYLVRDRNGLPQGAIDKIRKRERMQCLERRQIESYLLDEEILLKVAKKMGTQQRKNNITEEWITNYIDKKWESMLNDTFEKNMKTISHNYLKMPSIAFEGGKKPAEMAKEFKNKLVKEISEEQIKKFMQDEWTRLKDCREKEDWIYEFDTKNTFSRLCSELGGDSSEIARIYVDIVLAEKSSVFEEIEGIFKKFR